ncbi:MAG: DinB family protein [Gemmatimonadetes bacterium]|nr:DinB family protein [Gemmatimonadota bacterium]
MKAFTRRASLLTAVVLVSGAQLRAQAAAAPTGFRGEFLSQLGQLESKFAQLATAVPKDKYDWRPGTGVRSVCEVFMHISVDNYLLGKPFGLAMPKEMEGPTAENCPADKAAVMNIMKVLFAALRGAVTAMPDADLAQPFTLFGATQTKRAWLLATAEHAGEHLGQQIAYARMNGVVPPWSK